MRQTATDFCLYIIKIWKLYVRELIKNICPSDFSESNWTFIVSPGIWDYSLVKVFHVNLSLYVYLFPHVWCVISNLFYLQSTYIMLHAPGTPWRISWCPGPPSWPWPWPPSDTWPSAGHPLSISTIALPVCAHSYCSMLSYHQCSVETWLMMECYCMVSK